MFGGVTFQKTVPLSYWDAEHSAYETTLVDVKDETFRSMLLVGLSLGS